MYEAFGTNQFKRDFKKAILRNKDINKLKKVIRILIQGKPFSIKYKDHPLRGDYRDCGGCHIEPDWIMIYRIKDEKLHVVRVGSHSDLFQ
ncbi:MAG: type II toxin-antitoxin system mRNA interferase toxin, RelE/StbE family [Kiritimatiellae bacterium]|nr:type II toxin-antitoxin system mRNA interferase toxin, RelE/StbE family [Kiritimatiellia bacterium]